MTIVEYGDFECRDCGQAERALRGRHGDRLRYVFRHLPLADVHPDVQRAAEAAGAAAAQGAFWLMHDLLHAHRERLTLEHLRRCAERLELDLERFLHDLSAIGVTRGGRRLKPSTGKDVGPTRPRGPGREGARC